MKGGALKKSIETMKVIKYTITVFAGFCLGMIAWVITVMLAEDPYAGGVPSGPALPGEMLPERLTVPHGKLPEEPFISLQLAAGEYLVVPLLGDLFEVAYGHAAVGPRGSMTIRPYGELTSIRAMFRYGHLETGPEDTEFSYDVVYRPYYLNLKLHGTSEIVRVDVTHHFGADNSGWSLIADILKAARIFQGQIPEDRQSWKGGAE